MLDMFDESKKQNLASRELSITDFKLIQVGEIIVCKINTVLRNTL